MKTHQLLFAAALSFCSFSVFSQWQWVDASGQKVYSDRPPPAHIAPSQILKRPSNSLPTAEGVRYSATPSTATEQSRPTPTAQDAAAAANPTQPAAPPPPPAQEQAHEKAQEDVQRPSQEEAERKKHEAKQAEIRRGNCQRARDIQASLQSGALHAHVNEKGERGLMTEAQRQAQLQRSQALIKENCR